MLALQLKRPAPVETRPLEPVELPLPEPGHGELRIRVLTCGVCHTDRHEVEGDIPLPRLPLVPGHEIIGTIDKLGPGLTEPKIGTVVGIPWLYATCGQCRFCTRGDENLCDNIRFTGLHVDGGYAEFTLARAGYCYPIPAGLDPVAAAPLMCAGVIGYRGLRLAGAIGPGRRRTFEPFRLGLFGFGASAHIGLQIAKHQGSRVAVFTRAEKHRILAHELGADFVGSADDRPPGPLDAAIIFAPAGELVAKALALLDKGGTLVLAGIHMSPIPAMDYALIYQERTVRSVANSTRQDVIDLLKLATTTPLRTVTETFPLKQANEALVALKHSALRASAVLVVGDTIEPQVSDQSSV